MASVSLLPSIRASLPLLASSLPSRRTSIEDLIRDGRKNGCETNFVIGHIYNNDSETRRLSPFDDPQEDKQNDYPYFSDAVIHGSREPYDSLDSRFQSVSETICDHLLRSLGIDVFDFTPNTLLSELASRPGTNVVVEIGKPDVDQRIDGVIDDLPVEDGFVHRVVRLTQENLQFTVEDADGAHVLRAKFPH